MIDCIAMKIAKDTLRQNEEERTCAVTDPSVKLQFLQNMAAYCQQSSADAVVEDVEDFLTLLSHCNTASPWVSSSDSLRLSGSHDGWFPSDDRSREKQVGEEWMQLEELFRERLLLAVKNACKFDDGACNDRGGEWSVILRQLRLLSMFLGGEALLNEYVNARVAGLRGVLTEWIVHTAHGSADQQTIQLIKSIFEGEYELGVTGIFQGTSPSQLLHSVCLSPLLEELVLTESKDAASWVHLFHGFAVLSKFAEDLHNRLIPVAVLSNETNGKAEKVECETNRDADNENITDDKKHADAFETVRADRLSTFSDGSGGTLFEPVWADRTFLLAKPIWLWSYHFVARFPLMVGQCEDIVNKVIQSLDQLSHCQSPADVTVTTVALDGQRLQFYSVFADLNLLSKLVVIANDRHLVIDMKQEMVTLESSMVKLANAMEKIGLLFPKNLSWHNFDLLLSSARYCVNSLQSRLEETSTAGKAVTQSSRTILNSFGRIYDSLHDHSIHVNLRWLKNYILQDYGGRGGYSDVKPPEDDNISPSFRLWFWRIRKHTDEPNSTIRLLDATISLILARLAHIRVSQAQQRQLWRDVWFVLRSTVDLLLCCDDFPVVGFLGCQREWRRKRGVVWSMIGHCEKLLSVALVLCLPFKVLNRVTKKGYTIMLENLRRSKESSLWLTMFPEEFTGLNDSSSKMLPNFLLRLVSISKLGTHRRRLLTLLCLHAKRNALSTLLFRSGPVDNAEASISGDVNWTMITSLIWILTYGRVDSNALADASETSIARTGSSSANCQSRSICEEPWFPAICDIVTEEIGGDLLKRTAECTRPFQHKFPAAPCGCDRALWKNTNNDEVKLEWEWLRQRLRLLPISILHFHTRLKRSSRVNLLYEILSRKMTKIGREEDLDNEALMQMVDEHDGEEDGEGALCSGSSYSVSMWIELVQDRLETLLTVDGMIGHLDTVGDFMGTNAEWLSRKLVNDDAAASDAHQKWRTLPAGSFSTEMDEQPPAVDDNAQCEKFLPHLSLLTELEFRCLLRNRPEHWDSQLEMDAKMKKHIQLIAKVYCLTGEM